MDQNKAQLLDDIGYDIRPCCALCKYAQFPNNDWGSCDMFLYDHKKHTSRYKLSITKIGCCPKFDLDEAKKQQLGGFQDRYMP